MTIIGVDFGAATLAEADQLLRRLPVPEEAIACTHLIRRGTPHVACSLRLPADQVAGMLEVLAAQDRPIGISGAGHESGPRELVAGAAIAAGRHAARTSGRAVIYPGVKGLIGDVTAMKLVATSYIDRILVLPGRSSPDPSTTVITRDHVRPEWINGVLTLVTTPAGPGMVTPFELPDPTPCCGDGTEASPLL
ncbi:hypothetical protein DMH04_00475 [Kibdelosporangium aridum]|uniref:Uncharacterized protein n=1 Tax=Kibdelosporangium aridum TaxID=2030 RepID=A0A428ZU18_KIBAR|nr:hypothetical protein [Kibdelosporangium aridum]RSM91517.1 hypothetical protein DMH04_00475 [Kibdelosporangium aridum]